MKNQFCTKQDPHTWRFKPAFRHIDYLSYIIEKQPNIHFRVRSKK